MDFGAYRLADLVAHGSPVAVEGVGGGQPESFQPLVGVGVGYHLAAGQSGHHQVESLVEIIWIHRGALEQLEHLRPGGVEILVQVQGGERAGRIPPPTMFLGKAGVERIGPFLIGHPQPFPAVGQRQRPWGQGCTLRRSNILATSLAVSSYSPSSNLAMIDRLDRTGAGLRTTAGIRSLLT